MTDPRIETCPKCSRPALPFDVHLAGQCIVCIRETAASLTDWQSHTKRITNPEG